jgi:hypothetical protein
MSEEKHIFGRGPLFERLSNLALFQIVKRKISQAVGRRWESIYYENCSGRELEGRQLVRIKSIGREPLSFRTVRQHLLELH